MIISESTKTFLGDLNKFSGLKLKNLPDLALLIEMSHGKEKVLDDAAFTAKYLNGLGKIIQGGTVPRPPPVNGDREKFIKPEALNEVRSEYKKHLKELNRQLKELTAGLERKEKDRFYSKFLSPSRESLIELTTLIYDLCWLKVYKNKLKRR